MNALYRSKVRFNTRSRWLSNHVKIVEVGPRDGLQNEPKLVSTDTKFNLIADLVKAGLSVVETTAFVSPKWVPQMADSSALFSRVSSLKGSFPVLVPNVKGLQSALAVGVKEIAIFGAVSEAFSQRNINCSINESFARFGDIVEAAKSSNVKIRGYVSTVIGCPYQGRMDPITVAQIAKRMYDLGCYEISLGDTIGVGSPKDFKSLLDAVSQVVPMASLAVHCHDTYGMAIANILVSLEAGIRVIDSSVAGLGGCPYAKGATGNVATEDVVYLCHGLGLQTGIDLNALSLVGSNISKELGRPHGSKAGLAISNKL